MHDTPATPLAEAADPTALEKRYQDSLISRHLPPWIRKLSPKHMRLLRLALKTGLACRHRLGKVLAQLEGIDAFARRTLQAAISRHHGAALDVGQLYLRQWYTYYAGQGTLAAGRYPLPESDYYDISLVEAALHNFTEQETKAQPRRNCVVDAAGVVEPRLQAVKFASLCRELDVGGLYQQHLGKILDRPSVEDLLAQLLAAGMLADAFKARVEGALDERELELVIRLCLHQQLGRLDDAPVVAKQLKLFDCEMQQIVVFDVVDVGLLRDSSQRVLVYVPGDPQGPWSARQDLEDYARHVLGKRLRDNEYRSFFRRFVLRRDSQRFFAAVEQRLDDVADWATRDLEQHMTAYPQPLLAHLAKACIAQIKDDAAVIAMPVANLDRALQQAHAQHLRAMAWTLAGVAALFVPAIGLALLLVMGWEMLKQVFHAVEDWREDDCLAALEHMSRVAEDLAWLGAGAAVTAGAREAWARSEWVDSLLPARLESGGEKLWHQDLTPFSSTPPAQAVSDEQGVLRLGDQRWVELDGRHYAARQSAEGQWQMLPYRGYAPELRDNDAGAWRLWCEQPGQWQGNSYLFRRLGGEFRQLEDAQIDQVFSILGLEADQLRALHVYGRAPDAELLDTVTRFRLVQRVQQLAQRLRTLQPVEDTPALELARRLPGAATLADDALGELAWRERRVLLQRLYEAQPFVESSGAAAVRRAFPSVHRLAAAELLAAASDADQQRLADTGKVPLLMGQAARAYALRIRVTRVCEALLIDTEQTLDLAKVVLSLIDGWPGADVGPRWQLFDGNVDAPLLTTRGHGRTFGLTFRDGLFSCSDASGAALGASGELFTVMAQAYEASQRFALGVTEPFAVNLRSKLAQQVGNGRAGIVSVLGKGQRGARVLAPMRLDSGRIGYPLSGRGAVRAHAPRSLEVRLRDLYPAYSKAQFERWLLKLEQAGRNPEAELAVLENQATLLAQKLATWQTKGWLVAEHGSRKRFRRALMECWRELIPGRLSDEPVLGGHSWTFAGSDMTSLPSIPQQVSFEHITVLVLREMKLTTLSEEFLRAFPNLRSLEITGCQLQRVTLTPGMLSALEVLDLSNNRIILDSSQVLTLNACTSLRYLNLSNNPLHTTFSVQAMPHLSVLRLANTRIWVVPYGCESRPRLHTLDLSRNFIRRLPADFVRSPVWTQGYVDLDRNFLAMQQGSAWQQAWNEPLDSPVPNRLRWMDRIKDASQRDKFGADWASVDAMPGADEFMSLLDNLARSADFRDQTSAQLLVARVANMFQAMIDDPELAEDLLAKAIRENCADNAAVRFSDLEVRHLVWRVEHEAAEDQLEQALLHLGGQLWRLDQVKRLAWDIAHGQANAGRETVEVELALCIALRGEEDLDLPVQVVGMLYPEVANIEPAVIVQVRRDVLDAQSEEALAVSLVERDFWKRYLEAHYGQRLRVPQVLKDEYSALEARQAPEAEIDQLQARINQHEYETLLQITHERLARAAQ